MNYLLFSMLYLLLAIESHKLHTEKGKNITRSKKEPHWYVYIFCAICWPVFILVWLIFDAIDESD